MDSPKKVVSRRKVLGMIAAVSGLTFSGADGFLFAQEIRRRRTANEILGPFYPVLKPLDQDADLTVVAGRKDRARGKIIHLTGRVLNTKGEPAQGARVEIWQANTFGRYSHPSDQNLAAPLDPNFQGYSVQLTDAEGRYRFKTIKPGPYPVDPKNTTWLRPPHIHFDVTGKASRMVTQMYFDGEPLNEKDLLLQSLATRQNKASVIAKLLPPTKDLEPDSLLIDWNIFIDG